MPGLVQLQKENPNIKVIGFHVGNGTPEQIAKVVKAQKLPYPVVSSDGWDELKAWGAKSIPTLALIDKKGELRALDKPGTGEEKAVELSKE